MNKYTILQKVLTQIISEGAKHYSVYVEKKGDTSYKPRSLALIHLFLNVKFGLENFHERHKLITDDDRGDGGVDAYFIDEIKHIIYFIQAKWRNTEKNFEEKSILSDELAKMEVEKIMSGDDKYVDEAGIEKNFSPKIIELEKIISKLKDLEDYRYEVIVIANKNLKDKTLKKILGIKPIFYNYKEIYQFLFLYLSGVFYDPDKISFSFRVDTKHNYLCEKNVQTSIGVCRIILCFVSTDAIAKELNKYKNAILKYNPRCYLGLSGRKISEEKDSELLSVNNSIKKSVLMDYNDFAILNNGITILATNVKPNDKNGKKNIVDLHLYDPQIINGGQTAYTLSKLYKDHSSKLKNKEVLLRIIEIKDANESFLNDVSKAANKQNVINDDDRRSNDQIQKIIQMKIYSEFGYLYERKRGEFFEVLEKKIVNKSIIINKRDLAKSAFSFLGYPSEARSEGYKKIFSDRYNIIFPSSVDIKKLIFSYFSLKTIERIARKSSDYDVKKYGNALRYGKLSLVYVLSGIYDKYKDFTDIEVLINLLNNELKTILLKWISFEDYAINKDSNSKYFNTALDFDNYYKGNTLKNDLDIFFKLKKIKN